MQHKKEIKIGEKKVTVKELTVRQIIEISRNFSNTKPEDNQDDATTLANIVNSMKENMELAVEGITLEELMDCSPSDIDQIYKTFKEVNKTFLSMAERMGILSILKQMLDAMRKDFFAFHASLSNQDTRMQ